MLSLVLCVLLSTLGSASGQGKRASLASAFNSWKHQFGDITAKRPGFSASELHRNFARNLCFIKTHQTQGFTLSLNEFADLDIPSLLSPLNITKEEQDPKPRLSSPFLLFSPSAISYKANYALSRPRELDLRTCSHSSWAFAVTSALEAAYWKKTGEVRMFSEQELVDCACGRGCSDDCVDSALNYLAVRDSISDTRDYKYGGKVRACTRGQDILASNTDVIPALTGSGESTLLDWVGNKGPVIAPMHASRSFFFYHYGIYNKVGIQCEKDKKPNYWITVVGYASDHWLLRGVLGPNWGEGGYMRLGRYFAGECSLFMKLRMVRLQDGNTPSGQNEWDTVPRSDRVRCWNYFEGFPPGKSECERNDCNFEGGQCFVKAKLTLYNQPNYQGVAVIVYGSIPDLGLFGMYRAVRSIKVHRGVWMGYSEKDYGENERYSYHSWSMFTDEPNLFDRGAQNMASIRAIPQGQDLISLYEHTWARGKTTTIFRRITKMPGEWNDKFSSAYSLQEFEACKNDKFRKCQKVGAGFTGNIGEFLNDEITSVRVY